MNSSGPGILVKKSEAHVCLESLVVIRDKEWEAPGCLESLVAICDKKSEASKCLESLVAQTME